MVDITAVSNAVLEAVQPFIKSLFSGSASLQSVAESVSSTLGRAVSPDDVLRALQIHARNGVAFADSAASMAATTMQAAELAAERAAQQAIAAGAEQAAVEVARQRARQAVLQQSVKQVATRGIMTTVTRTLASLARGGAQVFLGLSAGAWLLLGLATGGILIGGYIWSQGDAPVQPGTRMTGQNCPELVYAQRKCPWTPEGYSVGECSQGFCWDGGPRGALACKQENDVPNAGRTYTTDVACNQGYVAQRDPCTGVIVSCTPG
jgi:hypothetical protein